LTETESVPVRSDSNVRFGSKADIRAAKSHVRFSAESGHLQCTRPCLLWANSGHGERNSLLGLRLLLSQFWLGLKIGSDFVLQCAGTAFDPRPYADFDCAGRSDLYA
jgi:hypothetical protein